MMTKEYCSCKNMAVWVYMPGFSSGEHPFFCDDCVPRGCECNYYYTNVDDYYPPSDNPDSPLGDEGIDWKWIEKDVCWVGLDGKKREYPCSEYDYEPDGFEREINPHMYEEKE